jgi:hypothetical protein
MTHHRNIIKRLAAIGLAACLIGIWASPASASDQSDARAGTAPFHNIDAATNAGYGLFTDAAGIACIDDPAGGMGIHYVGGAPVADGDVSAATPEALVYEPQDNGRLRLVAVEYVVFQADWDAKHEGLPSLFGQDFTPVGADNRYGLPPFYELHVWLWKHNPSGMFEDWNPRVSCAGAQAQGSSTRRARASAHQMRWTQEQLTQLATAYAKKNPGWIAPSATSAGATPAERTWTPEALDRLAAAYSALNPGWVRP